MARKMLTLADFGTASTPTREVKLGELTATVQPLSLFERNALVAAWPAPTPPMVKPADKGSLAEPEPDENDVEYVAAKRVHVRQTAVLEAAIAIGYAPAPFEAGLAAMDFSSAVQANRGKAWAAATLREWEGTADKTGRFSEAQVLTVRDALAALEKESDLGN